MAHGVLNVALKLLRLTIIQSLSLFAQLTSAALAILAKRPVYEDNSIGVLDGEHAIQGEMVKTTREFATSG